jgi:hypothetical protein
MFTLMILLAVFIVIDIAALRWGVDSRDGLTSCEWVRRWHWSRDADGQWGVRWLIL